MTDMPLFSASDINHIRLFLVLFCVSLALLLLFSLRQQWHFFKTQPAKLYHPPKRIVNRIPLPALNYLQFRIIGLVMVVSLLAAASGTGSRFFVLIALLCYFPYFGHIMHLEDVRRKTHLIPVILGILFFAPALDAPFSQATPQWPLMMIKIAIVQMYFSAGLQKLYRSGISWATGRNLQAYLAVHYLWGDMENALHLVKHRWLCALLAISVLIFQLTIWLILFWPELTVYYVHFAIAFHLGTAITMRIYYLKYLTPVYMVFITDLVAHWVGLK